jgi:hypothetical protein
MARCAPITLIHIGSFVRKILASVAVHERGKPAYLFPKRDFPGLAYIGLNPFGDFFEVDEARSPIDPRCSGEDGQNRRSLYIIFQSQSVKGALRGSHANRLKWKALKN